MSKCPVHTKVPHFLLHLRVSAAGLPIPFSALIDEDGKPDFRINDIAKVTKCMVYRLCGVCGLPLEEFIWFTGGPLCEASHFFADPPMHEECARYALKACPFLSGKREEYSERGTDLPAHLVKNNDELQAAPGDTQLLLKGCRDNVKIVRRSGQVLYFYAEQWLQAEEYKLRI
jgi:hypothetical protein